MDKSYLHIIYRIINAFLQAVPFREQLMSKKKDKHADISIKNKKEENYKSEEQDASFLGATQASGQVPSNQENDSASNKENLALNETENQAHIENKNIDAGKEFNKKTLKDLLNKPKLSKEEKARLKQKKKEEEKREKEYQKGTFKKNMKALGIILVLGIFTGSGLGVWYFNFALKSKVDYSIYTVADYMPNLDERFSTLFGITAETDKLNWVEKARELGIENPSQLSAIDNYLLAMYNAQNESELVIESEGLVKSMGTSQTVYSLKTFDGSLYTFESISTGFLTIAFHDEMTVDENGNVVGNVDIYNGKSGTITPTSAEWELDQSLSPSDYTKLTGGLLNVLNPYIISEATVLNNDVEVVIDENGNYSMTFELHPIYSVLNYYRQVRRTGDLEADPYFHNVTQTIVMDKDWNLISTYVEEDYNAVKMGFGVGCSGNLKQNFFFDGSYQSSI